MLYVTHKRKTTQKAIILWCFLCKWVRKTKPFFLWKTFIFVENCFPPAYKITFRQVFLKKRQWGGGGKYTVNIIIWFSPESWLPYMLSCLFFVFQLHGPNKSLNEVRNCQSEVFIPNSFFILLEFYRYIGCYKDDRDRDLVR